MHALGLISLGIFIGFFLGWITVALMFHAARDEEPSSEYDFATSTKLCGAQMELGEICDLPPGHHGPHSHFLHW